MANVNGSQGNCGIQELYGLGSPTRELVSLVGSYAGRYAHVWFSDADVNGNATRLEQAILAYGLGSVVRSPGAVNPNTKNQITAYIWTPNQPNITKYLASVKS